MNPRRTVLARHALRGSCGAALVAVLWTVAALTVLVAGVVQAQRAELRTAQAGRDQLQAQVLGMDALARVAQRMAGGDLLVVRKMRLDQAVDGAAVAVDITPMTGLIDPNLAPEALLARLFASAGAADPGALARNLAERRVGTPNKPPRPLEAVDELLAMDGMDYDVHASIAPLVAVGTGGSGRINPLAAPLDVLRLLAGGNEAVAARVAADRDAGLAAIDTTRLDTTLMDAAVSTRFRFAVRVPVDGGAVFELRADLDLSPGARLPWRVLRSQVVRVATH